MLFVITVVTCLGAAVLWAMQHEEVGPEPTTIALRPWAGLPDAADIRRADFPLALGGYDRATVHAHLERVALAYETVLRARAQVEESARAQVGERVRPAVGESVDPANAEAAGLDEVSEG